MNIADCTFTPPARHSGKSADSFCGKKPLCSAELDPVWQTTQNFIKVSPDAVWHQLLSEACRYPFIAVLGEKSSKKTWHHHHIIIFYRCYSPTSNKLLKIKKNSLYFKRTFATNYGGSERLTQGRQIKHENGQNTILSIWKRMCTVSKIQKTQPNTKNTDNTYKYRQ